MPSYEYECVGCHTQKEVQASIHDEVPEQMCEFDGSKMYRIYTNPGVIFNATGFYSTRLHK